MLNRFCLIKSCVISDVAQWLML